MPDGGGLPGGLNLGEIGAGAKKAGQQVQKKVINPFLQSAKSQFGMPVKQGGQTNPVKNFGLGANDISSDIKSQTAGIIPGQQTEEDVKKQQRQAQIGKGNSPTAGVFDIAGLAKNIKSQSGVSQQDLPKNQSSNPPNEFIPKQSSTFDPRSFSDDFNESDPFAAMQKANVMQNQPAQPSEKEHKMQEDLAKQQAEDKQNYDRLLQKLHQMQTDDVLKVGEEGDKNKQEEEQKKQQEDEEEERKKEEKEQKMQEQITPQGKKKHGFMGYKKVKKAMGDMLGAIVKRKQGANEGRGGKG